MSHFLDSLGKRKAVDCMLKTVLDEVDENGDESVKGTELVR